MLTRTSHAAAAALILLFISASSAHADADLESATPGPGDVVSVVPVELVARFGEAIDSGRSSLELRDAAGSSLARGAIDPADSRTMRMTLPRLEPGVYQVRWTTYSADDGHLARDTYEFTVSAPSPPPAPPTDPDGELSPGQAAPSPSARGTQAPSPTAVPDSPDNPVEVIPVLVGAGLLVLGLGAWLLRRR